MSTQVNHTLLQAAAFAAEKHRDQRRKDTAATPYINHPLKVALTLMEAGEYGEELILAALLHDTIEDTRTKPDEIMEKFGPTVLAIVLEVTDDKNLSKEERKELQVANSHLKSESAKKLKLADKICNIYDIIHHPPHGWSVERRLEYLAWAERVLKGLRGVNAKLEARLEELIRAGRQTFMAHMN
jgi:guanosine-3',5'-bis(diphosphate) 3'-pyrophosphohydrolase